MAIGVDGLDGIHVQPEVTLKGFVFDLNLVREVYMMILVLTQ